MAVTKEQKRLFNEKVKTYKNQLEDIKRESSTLKAVGRSNSIIDPYVQIQLAVLSLQRANTLIVMSRLSIEIQNLKNDSYLNDARKEISNKLNDLLRIVGDNLDGSLTENRDNLKKIEKMTPPRKIRLMEGFKRTTEEVKEVLGPKSKWRWSFPEIHLKTAILAKNMFDFVEFGKVRDPGEEFFRDRHELLAFITNELLYSAQEYRSRYELSTKDVSDLQIIQRIQELLIRIYSVTGNQNELVKMKNALDAMKEKIEIVMAEKTGKKKPAIQE